MSTLTKLVLGAMGALRPGPALGDTTRRLELPPAQRDQPGALMQDFVDEAPLDLVFIADHARMSHVPVQQREGFTSVAAGAISQNVSLYCAANGLATVLRAWIDREAVARALGLTMSQHVLLSQTVGLPA